MGFVVAVLIAFLGTEIIGYFLHMLLHSGKVPALSRAHMQHHLRDYGPGMLLRSPNYKQGAAGRGHVGGLGLEWLLPIALIVAGLVGGMTLLGITWPYQITALVSASLWGAVMFGKLHDAMHLETTRLERLSWFRRARALHDVHHLHISNDGRMNANYGIAFYVLDRLLGTYRKEAQPNEKGKAAALERYRDIL